MKTRSNFYEKMRTIFAVTLQMPDTGLTPIVAFWDGGDKGSRTPDLLNAIETLYQLSYIPKRKTACRISKHSFGRKRFFVENSACM